MTTAKRPTTWDCPHCGRHYDTTVELEAEEATVGGIGAEQVPHAWCPACRKCMGCHK